MRYKFLFIFLIATAFIVFLTVYGSTGTDEKAGQGTGYHTALRLIGHKLLLSSGDTKSRVMPVQQLSDEEYQVYFENELALEPDSIFNIISKVIKSYSLPNDYTANVLACSGNEIVYSFVMSGIEKNVIVPCLGRTLPKGCYYISVVFSPKALMSKQSYMLAGGGIVLLLVAYFYFKGRRSNTISETAGTPASDAIAIGAFFFYTDQRQLEINGERIELTDTESKILHIFALTPNEIIARDQLQKEVWENKGVIVTRSLDVFISKLRKKLEKDPTVKLVNVHGKGYKLEIPGSLANV